MQKALIVFICILAASAVMADDAPFQSAHQSFLEQHSQEPPAFRTARPTLMPLIGSKSTGDHVAGFYPYWASLPADQLPYDYLTVVCFFSLEIDQFGNLTNLHGWPNGMLVDEAHTAGVKVVVTVTNFSSSSIDTLLGLASFRSNAIDNIVDQVLLGYADGVNIDFEGVPLSAKSNLVTFMNELDYALSQNLSTHHLSICTPAIDWASAFDYDQLAATSDFLFIMAYDYHYRGGDPGPVAPLYAGGIWANWAGIDYTLDDYETYISPYTLGKVVLGLPLYGYDWPTANGTVPGASTGLATSRIMSVALGMAESGTYGSPHFDAGSQTPYLTYYQGGTRQLWYDDPDSLASRMQYAKNRGAGGVGFWALGYDDNNPDLWASVDQYFGADPDDDDDDSDDDVSDDDDDTTPGRICGGGLLAELIAGTTGR